MSEPTRAWIYRVSTAAFAVLVAYGLLSPDEVSAWLQLAAAVSAFGSSGLAAANTSTSREP